LITFFEKVYLLAKALKHLDYLYFCRFT